jgi:4-carboxymuconolactone decarboxylase
MTDEHVDTAPRLPDLLPPDLDDDQRALYEAFIGGPRQTQADYFPVADAHGRLSGPYRAMLLSPTLGSPMERVGRAVRYEAALPARWRELIILTVAHANASDVEWRAHERLARAEGVPPETVDSLRSSAPVFTDPGDADIHGFVHGLLTRHIVDDQLFERLRIRIGLPGIFETIATAGYYQFIAHVNNAFGLEPS